MKNIYVVSHSHWDREWYFNIDDSNVLLSQNLNYLLKKLEGGEYPSYTFDAQTSIIDEYLKVYPNDKKRIARLVEKKKLFIGPWYTQSDTLLVNKESLIRNLLIGSKIAKEFGHSLNIGYLPDVFGQNHYLPSIFKGFGIDYAIFQRGIYNDELNGDLNFYWEAPDGVKIKTNNLLLGYGPGKFINSDDEYIKSSLVPMLEKLSINNKSTDNLLLPSGGDQVLVRSELPEVIQELNKKTDYNFILSDYESFMEETWKNDFTGVIKGELRGTESSRIHRTIGSQRADTKYHNHKCEEKLIFILEPLSYMASELGVDYDPYWINKAWKELFDVHAHDSIGGCNSDTTNSDIMKRLERVERIIDNQIHIIKRKITRGITPEMVCDSHLTLFNLLPKKHQKEVELTIFTKKKYPLLYLDEDTKVETSVLENNYISGGKRVIVTADGEYEEEVEGYYENKLIIQSIDFSGFGYKTLYVKEVDDLDDNLLTKRDLEVIENDFYEITLNNKQLMISDKKSQNTTSVYFELLEDGGDSYDFSPVKGASEVIIKEFKYEAVKTTTNYQQMILTTKLSRDTEIKTILTLTNNHLLRLEHNVNNKLMDKRVRIGFETGISGAVSSWSDSGFSLVEHKIKEPRLEIWRENKYAEAPYPIYNLENAALLSDDKCAIQLITKGIKEYEIKEIDKKQDLMLTLYRSVDKLGKDNLLWRPGRASGINNKVVETPDARLLKELNFSYYLDLGQEITTKKFFDNIEMVTTNKTYYQAQSLNTYLERLERFTIPEAKGQFEANYNLFTFTGGYLSTLKQAEDKSGGVLRAFNPLDGATEIKINNSVNDIVEVNLGEEEMTITNFIIGKKGYKSYLIKK